jgi:hypothetical protein
VKAKTVTIACISAAVVIAMVGSWALTRHDTSARAEISVGVVEATQPRHTAPQSETDPSGPAEQEGPVLAQATNQRDEALKAQYGCADWPCPEAIGDLVDPRVASSIAEASWMAARGFPTNAQRDWAASVDGEAILLRATGERSIALRMLGLEAVAGATDDVAVARSAAQELDDLAGQGRQHFALYAGINTHLRVAALSAANDSVRIHHLGAAATMLKKAILLGDAKAIALYALFPPDVAGDLNFWIRAEGNALAQLQRGDVNPTTGGFGYRDAEARPNQALRDTYARDLAALKRSN